MYRKDEIYLETLNPEKISFSEKEEAIICKCKSADKLNKRLKTFLNVYTSLNRSLLSALLLFNKNCRIFIVLRIYTCYTQLK